MSMSTHACGAGTLAARKASESFAAELGEAWLARGGGVEVQRILRRNERAFHLFVGVCTAVCALILAAIFLA